MHDYESFHRLSLLLHAGSILEAFKAMVPMHVEGRDMQLKPFENSETPRTLNVDSSCARITITYRFWLYRN